MHNNKEILNVLGKNGLIEGVIEYPNKYKKEVIAIICSPHPLFKGTMNNKVITTIARSFNEIGIKTIRFNYRGVGNSEGKYDNGKGEVDDVLTLIKDQATNTTTNKHIILAGFSFGAMIAYNTCLKHDNILSLLSIAPAINNNEFNLKSRLPNAIEWCIIQCMDDTTVNVKENLGMLADVVQNEMEVILFKHAGHFFHNRLTDLKNQIQHYYTPRVRFWSNNGM